MAGCRHQGRECARGLPRPSVNKAADGEPDLLDLAAAYLFAIVRNHPFSDGNKRTGFLAAYTFLLVNGHEITADNPEFVLDVAAGLIGEDNAARWFRDCTQPRS